MREPPPRLRAEPDWATAAQRLVDGCAHAPNAAYRVELLERLCGVLGDRLYPGFLNVLCLVGERGTPAAQAAVADALVDTLRSGRLPAGRRGAWGAGLRPDAAPTGAALGPVEYLCAWYAEPAGAQAPSAARLDRALRALLELLSHSERARTLYIARLLALSNDPLDGTLSRATRQSLQALAEAWRQGGPAAAVDAVLGSVAGAGLRSLGPAAVR